MSKKRYLLQDEDFASLISEIQKDPQLTTNEISNEDDRLKYNNLWRVLNYRVMTWIQNMRSE